MKTGSIGHLDSSADIVFVNMPFDLLQAPNLGLGTLKAVLAEAGIPARVIYGNLLYAESFGIEWYLEVERQWNKSYLGDWLFQGLLFPEKCISAEEPASRFKYSFNSSDLTSDRLEQRRLESEAFLDDLAERILQLNPRLVGCSLTVVHFFSSLALMKIIREKRPDITIIAGGSACDADQGLALHQGFPFLDYVFCGDADNNIVPFAESILCKSEDFISLPGLVSRSQRNKSESKNTIQNRATTESLDHLPIPDFSDYFDTLRHSPNLSENIIPTIPFEASRGCRWGEKQLCLFCGDCGAMPRYRTKSADLVMSEINIQSERYECDRFYATDNMVNPAFFNSLFPSLEKENKGWSFFFESRSGITKADVENMRRAGVTYMQAGLESLDSQTLRLLNKGAQSWENIQLLKWCRQYGVLITWFIMTGIPGEDDHCNSQQAETIPALLHLEPPRFVGGIRPDRFSPYYKNAQKNKLTVLTDESYLSFFDLPQDLVGRFAFHLYEKRQRFIQNDELDFILRPGNTSLNSAVIKWQKAFWNEGEFPALEIIEDGGDSVTIRDSRSGLENEMLSFSGLERRILLDADCAPFKKRLYDNYISQDIRQAAIDEAVEHLIRFKIILDIDGRLLSLPLKQSCMPYPDDKNLPMGWINGQARRSI